MPAVVFAKFVQLIHHNIRKREEFIMSENKKKTVAFVPVKLNNERIPGKNPSRLMEESRLLHIF